jgi:hypothetical protein
MHQTTGIPTAKRTGLPDRRFSTDGRHNSIPIAKTDAATVGAVLDPSRPTLPSGQASAEQLHGQHTNADADSGASTPPEMIGRHGGTPKTKAGAANNQTPTRLSTAQGCVATGTHCVPPANGDAFEGTPVMINGFYSQNGRGPNPKCSR